MSVLYLCTCLDIDLSYRTYSNIFKNQTINDSCQCILLARVCVVCKLRTYINEYTSLHSVCTSRVRVLVCLVSSLNFKPLAFAVVKYLGHFAHEPFFAWVWVYLYTCSGFPRLSNLSQYYHHTTWHCSAVMKDFVSATRLSIHLIRVVHSWVYSILNTHTYIQHTTHTTLCILLRACVWVSVGCACLRLNARKDNTLERDRERRTATNRWVVYLCRHVVSVFAKTLVSLYGWV